MRNIYVLPFFLFFSTFIFSQAFVTTWKTDNPGISDDNQIAIPTFPGEVYDYSVDWGDGALDTNVTGDITHTYAAPGTYQVSITGVFPRIYFNYDGLPSNEKDRNKIISVDQWGDQVWTSMENAFNGCTNLDVTATDTPDLSNVLSSQGMFYLCSSLVGNSSFNSWDVGNIENFVAMFRGATLFNQNLGSWDVSNATDLALMFSDAINFNQPIGAWNVGKVTNMDSLFKGAFAFDQDIGSWNVANVIRMSAMFHQAFAFDQDIGNWNVGNVIDMQGMFLGAIAFNQDISGWNVGKVINMSEMFFNAVIFNQDISSWNVSNVTNMSSMFEGAMDFDQDLGNWDVSKVTTMENMFANNALSTNNYDNTLTGWYQLPSLQENVVFDGGESQYCNSVVERLKLMYEKNWVITDEGKTAGFCAERPFITTWKTDNPGSSADNQVTIPTFSGEIYNYSVDWGDGTSDTNITGDITHTYATPGTYDVSITGEFPQIYFVNQGDKEKILLIKQWGDIAWSSMLNAFHGCGNLDVVAEDIPDLTNVNNTQYMFRLCGELVGNEAFKIWDVSSVTSMDFMFREAAKFNQDISGWNTGQVTGMRGMFLDAKAFNQDIGTWNVQNVTDMERMFRGAEAFNQDLDSWNTSKVANMFGMFFLATSFNGNIGSWNVSNVVNMSNMFAEARSFNQDISSWNVSNVTEMGSMFDVATDFNQDLNDWNVSNVVNMARMFMNATSFNGHISDWNVSNVQFMGNMFNNVATFNQDISGWDVSSVTDMAGMLAGATSFDQDLGDWDVSNVADMTSMLYDVTLSTANYDSLLKGWSSLPSLQTNIVFDAGNSQYCASANERQSIIDMYGWTVNDAGPSTECFFITTWKTDNPGVSDNNQISLPIFGGPYTVNWGDGTSDFDVTDNITHQYASPGVYEVSIHGSPNFFRLNAGGDGPKLLEVNQWGNIEWGTMSSAFNGCANMDVVAEDAPNLTKVKTMFSMFDGCESLKGNAAFNTWDIGSVENLIQTFSGCTLFNADISSWDTSNVRTMTSLFNECQNFNQDISNWDVSNVQSMLSMFNRALNFNQDIGGWDVSNVVDMGAMFQETGFNQDISNWDVSNATDMRFMFNLTTDFNRDISSWDVSNVENMEAMFSSSEAFNQDISSWDVSQVSNMSTMFNLAKAFNQDISSWDVSKVANMRRMFFRNNVFDQDLGDWNVSQVADMTEMFTDAGLSLENYDKTLNGWASLPSLQSSVIFDAGNSQYCEAVDARQFIINTYGWAINDAGEAPLCNEDNDVDGVFDHKDDCLNSLSGAMVDERGCDIIANDAIQVYVLTPSCTNSSDGALQISMNTAGYLLDIIIEGNGISNQFDDVPSESGFEINDLAVGAYTVTISIPEILFEQIYGVTVNELDAVSGKRESLDPKARTVSYIVSGSKNYEVSVNDKTMNFNFDSVEQQTISLKNLNGQNKVIISGESDCQGKIVDSFFMGNAIQVFPTITSSHINLLADTDSFTAHIYSLEGRMVKEEKFNQKENHLDISSLKSGLYIIKMTIDGKEESVKIIKR